MTSSKSYNWLGLLYSAHRAVAETSFSNGRRMRGHSAFGLDDLKRRALKEVIVPDPSTVFAFLLFESCPSLPALYSRALFESILAQANPSKLPSGSPSSLLESCPRFLVLIPAPIPLLSLSLFRPQLQTGPLPHLLPIGFPWPSDKSDDLLPEVVRRPGGPLSGAAKLSRAHLPPPGLLESPRSLRLRS